MEEQLVIIKNGKTTNLFNNRLIFDGDLINRNLSRADIALADGEYNVLGIDLCMQHDDNDRKTWILTHDEEQAINGGWPRRMVYYYWKDERSWRDKPSPHCRVMPPPPEPTDNEKQKFNEDALYAADQYDNALIDLQDREQKIVELVFTHVDYWTTTGDYATARKIIDEYLIAGKLDDKPIATRIKAELNHQEMLFNNRK